MFAPLSSAERLLAAMEKDLLLSKGSKGGRPGKVLWNSTTFQCANRVSPGRKPGPSPASQQPQTE